MKNIEKNSRRDFLKRALSISVMSLACPHFLRGELIPEIEKTKNGSQILVTGVYTLDLDEYPELKELWGSIRIKIPRNTEGEIGSLEELIITRVPYEECHVYFSALNSICPHEGNRVNDFHPDFHIFECPGHGSQFNAMGTYIWGPEAQNLITYQIDWRWQPGDRYLKIMVPFYNEDAAAEDVMSSGYLKANYPNPFKANTSIPYGLENDANIDISLYDVRGNKVATVVSGFVSAGSHIATLSGENLAAGLYFCKLFINGRETFITKIIKQQ